MPRTVIFGPQRRSIVSSIPTTTGPSGTNTATSQPSRMRARACPDQRARLSTPWKRAKSAPSRRLSTDSAALTVRRPGARTVPAARTRTRSQVGRVKKAVNGVSQCLRIGGAGNIEAVSRCLLETTDTDEELHHGPPRSNAGAYRSLQPQPWRPRDRASRRQWILAPQRAVRRPGRPAEANRRGRQGPCSRLASRKMGRQRAIRRPNHDARPRPGLYLFKPVLLDLRLIQPKNAQSRAEQGARERRLPSADDDSRRRRRRRSVLRDRDRNSAAANSRYSGA